VWNWFTRVANTRCHSLSWQIIIQTRWSEDDLIGRLTNPDNRHYDPEIAKQWTYINIPSIMDDEEIAAALGKKVGDALWPARFSLQLLDTARRLDPVGFSALHQGKPTPVEGAFYKVDHFSRGYSSVADLPKNMRYYMTGDLAVSTEITADKSAVGVWGLDERDELWLLPDLYWERKSSDQSVDQIIDFLKRYPIQEAFFEKGQLDRAIRPFLYKRMTEEKQYAPITGMPVSGSKGARSISFRGRCAQGKVHWPVFAPWWPKFKNVMLRFTGSGDDPEDDPCDMCALIGQALGNTFKAGKQQEASNVIRVGTLQWTRWAADRERRQRARFKNVAGY
jgi:predicted phage terminase large subunit-like protein